MVFANAELYALLLLVINGGALWIREGRKNRTWRSNGNSLKEIKLKLECMDKKIGETKVAVTEVNTKVTEQKDQCTKTVVRIDNAINVHNQQILDLAQNRGGKGR